MTACVREPPGSPDRVGAGLQGIRGEMVIRGTPGTERVVDFELAEDGSWYVRDRESSGPDVFDARSGNHRPSEPLDPQTPSYDLPPGPPDLSFPMGRTSIGLELGWVVRALAAEEAPGVKETTMLGRPAWFYETPVRGSDSGGSLDHDRMDVTVDRETALPLKVVLKLGDTIVGVAKEMRKIETGVKLDPERFQVTRTPQALSGGFVPTTLSEAATEAGFAPLLPETVPAGYRLSEVSVSTRSGPQDGETNIPVAGPVIAVTYRRGIDRIIVTARPVGNRRELWGDPYYGEGTPVTPDLKIEPVRTPLGTLELVLDPQTTAHVWGLTNELAVTIEGALTAEELRVAAESLRVPDLSGAPSGESGLSGTSERNGPCPDAGSLSSSSSELGCFTKANGHLDGDETADVVNVFAHLDDRGRPMRWQATARLGGGLHELSADLTGPEDDPGPHRRIAGVADLKGDRRGQVFVEHLITSTRSLLKILVVDNGALKLVSVPGGDDAVEFDNGSGGGVVSWIDCPGDGTISATSLAEQIDCQGLSCGWERWRRTLRLIGALTQSIQDERDAIPAIDPDRLPEFINRRPCWTPLPSGQSSAVSSR